VTATADVPTALERVSDNPLLEAMRFVAKEERTRTSAVPAVAPFPSARARVTLPFPLLGANS
jgi:hypothetical protein